MERSIRPALSPSSSLCLELAAALACAAATAADQELKPALNIVEAPSGDIKVTHRSARVHRPLHLIETEGVAVERLRIDAWLLDAEGKPVTSLECKIGSDPCSNPTKDIKVPANGT